MKIAIDMDGTLMEFPEIYKVLVETFDRGGHEFWVITGRTMETYADDIWRLEELFPHMRARYFINSKQFNEQERQLEAWSDSGEISLDRDEIVCMWKAREIVERGFDLVIDDAADKIRLYMDEDKGKGVLLLKSPTPFNQVFAKWGRSHIVSYSEEKEKCVGCQKMA